MSESTPAYVVVTRHPDAGNQYETFGDVQFIDIDLGSSFDGRPDNEEQARAWATSILGEVRDTPEQVRQYVYGVVCETIDGLISDEELSHIAAGDATKARLEELRAAIRAENISYGEIAELEHLAAFIDTGDVELLEWAGVPEFPDDNIESRLTKLNEALDAETDPAKRNQLADRIYRLRNGI